MIREGLPAEVEGLLEAAERYTASDLLLHEGRAPRLRIGGRLETLETPPLGAATFDALWSACQAPPAARDHDASLVARSGTRFRVNLLRQLGTRAAILRRIHGEVPSMESLGVPADVLRDWSGRRSGIILVCGPTGSGKSTTLAAAIEWMNDTAARHVVTIEDPIEYLFSSRQCLFTQREVGIDTVSFAEGLRRSLRQNPDVIFVGEIRDSDTATTAIQASETGHLVLATLHASNCADGIERLQLLFGPDERDAVRRTLSAQLLGMLCQRLLPAVEGGLALAVEYFSNGGAMRKYIAEGNLPALSDLIARSQPPAAQSFLAALADLVRGGRVAEETAAATAENPQELARALRGVSSSVQATRR